MLTLTSVSFADSKNYTKSLDEGMDVVYKTAENYSHWCTIHYTKIRDKKTGKEFLIIVRDGTKDNGKIVAIELTEGK